MFWRSIDEKNAPRMLLAIVGIGLVFASIRAQMTANQSQLEANAKPCVVVFGATKSPARVEMQNPIRLADVINLAGGPAREGETFIQIVHAGPTQKCYQFDTMPLATTGVSRYRWILPGSMPSKLTDLQRDDERANPYLQPGDIVVLLKGPLVYVTGAVIAPQAMSMKEGMTLTRAIALAGGPTRDARTRKVHIYRVKDGMVGQLDLLLDLNAIKKHHAEDPVLQPFDIIDVRRKGSW